MKHLLHAACQKTAASICHPAWHIHSQRNIMVVSGPWNMLSAPLFYCQQRRSASQQRADDSLNANSWGLLIANSWGLPQCKERRTASMQTAEGCLSANSWGLSQCKQRRTASMQTTEDCLNANSWGLPQCIHLRAASQQITDDSLSANSWGLPHSKQRRTASKQTARFYDIQRRFPFFSGLSVVWL